MEPPEPGHFWKTPFLWEPGCPEPPAVLPLRFVEAEDDWLAAALPKAMSHSLDESDQYAVAHVGAARAVEELMAILPQYFERPTGWWRAGIDASGRKVGFVLPVLFQDPARRRDGRPQGTIFYMGVLRECRGHGHALSLVHEATRIFVRANCWRIFCDASSANAPMLDAFRDAGYQERNPWQRPLA